MPTLCEISGVASPKDTDGISLAPVLLNQGKAPEHPFLYWEFPGYGGQQALRMGNWKGVVRPLGGERIELYDLQCDLGERHDVAGEHP